MNNKKKIVIILIFCLTLIQSVGMNKTIEAATNITSLAKTTNITIYRAVESALVEFDKVPHATGYKIYRKVGKSGKWLYLGKVKEKNYKRIDVPYRQFVDYDRSKSKNYSTKKNYTYKVVAYKGKVKSSKTKYSKKHKPNTVEFGYDALIYTNKVRAKKKKTLMVWSHELEKGAIIRSKELKKKWSHTRPDKTDCRTAWGYIEKRRPIGTTFHGACDYENIGESFGYFSWKDVFDEFMYSSGHRAAILTSYIDETVIRDVICDDFQTYKNDTIRYVGGLCAASYSKDKHKGELGIVYYDYAVGSINDIYKVNNNINPNYLGTVVRNSEYCETGKKATFVKR